MNPLLWITAAVGAGLAIATARLYRHRFEAARRRRANQASLRAASEAAVRRHARPRISYIGAPTDREPESKSA
jgi:hypothetical protein